MVALDITVRLSNSSLSKNSQVSMEGWWRVQTMANKCPLHDTVARMKRPAVTAEHCVAVCCASFPFVAGSSSACVWPSSVVTQHTIQLLYIMLHKSLHSVPTASFFDPPRYKSSCHVSEQWTSPAMNSRRRMGAHVISGGDPPWKQLLSSISPALARRFSKRLCCTPRLQSTHNSKPLLHT